MYEEVALESPCQTQLAGAGNLFGANRCLGVDQACGMSEKLVIKSRNLDTFLAHGILFKKYILKPS